MVGKAGTQSNVVGRGGKEQCKEALVDGTMKRGSITRFSCRVLLPRTSEPTFEKSPTRSAALASM